MIELWNLSGSYTNSAIITRNLVFLPGFAWQQHRVKNNSSASDEAIKDLHAKIVQLMVENYFLPKAQLDSQQPILFKNDTTTSQVSVPEWTRFPP
jgi:hypothetical protein